MRKLAATVALAIVLGLPNPAHAGWRETECRFQTLDGHHGWTQIEVQRTISCAARRFGISERFAYLVADHESDFQANPGSYDSYCGVYQLNRSSFPSWFADTKADWPRYAWYGPRCENARTNIFTAFHLVTISGGWEAHWCRWTWYC